MAQVQVNGAEKPAVRVRLDPAALAAAGLSGEDVAAAIRAANVTGPVGGFDGPDRAETIGTNGQLLKAADYRGLLLKTANGATVRLGDVASVIDGVANTRLAAWFGKQPAILLTVTKNAGANVIDTVDRVKAVLPLLQILAAARHPPDHPGRPHPVHPRQHQRGADQPADLRRPGAHGGGAVHAPAGAHHRRRRHRAAVHRRHAGRHVVLAASRSTISPSSR